MNECVKFGLVFSTMLSLSGCATSPPLIKSETLSNGPKVSIIFPAEDIPAIKDIGQKIDVGNYKNPTNSSYTYQVRDWKISETECHAERYFAWFPASGGPVKEKESNKFLCKLENSKPGTFNLYFTEAVYEVGNGILTNKPVNYGLKYTLKDAIKEMGSFEYRSKIEIDSPYNTDSIYSNFKRLSRYEAYSYGAKRDQVTGKIFDSQFWISVNGKETAVNIESFPYRNGSKTSIYFSVNPVVIDNEINFQKSYDAIKEKIESIVKS